MIHTPALSSVSSPSSRPSRKEDATKNIVFVEGPSCYLRDFPQHPPADFLFLPPSTGRTRCAPLDSGGTEGVSSGLALSAQHSHCPPGGICNMLALISLGEETCGINEVGRAVRRRLSFQAHVEERGQSGLSMGSVGGVGGRGCWTAREHTTDQVVFAVQDGECGGE